MSDRYYNDYHRLRSDWQDSDISQVVVRMNRAVREECRTEAEECRAQIQAWNARVISLESFRSSLRASFKGLFLPPVGDFIIARDPSSGLWRFNRQDTGI